MSLDNSSDSQTLEAKQKLIDATFAPKPLNVCQHLVSSSYEGNVSYVASQYMDDSYFIFWCCSDCAKAYFVPYPGVLVTEPECCDHSVEDFFEIIDADDEDINPYTELLEKNKKFYISRSEFDEKFGQFCHDEILQSKYKIPYGKVLKLIKSP